MPCKDIARLREQQPGPLPLKQVKLALLRQMSQHSYEREVRGPWRPVKYWLRRGFSEEEIKKAPSEQLLCKTIGKNKLRKDRRLRPLQVITLTQPATSTV